MAEVVPSPEERFSLALQGIDQVLRDLQLQLAGPDESHDMPANDDIQIKQTTLRDRDGVIFTVSEDARSDGNYEAAAEDQDEGGNPPRGNHGVSWLSTLPRSATACSRRRATSRPTLRDSRSSRTMDLTTYALHASGNPHLRARRAWTQG